MTLKVRKRTSRNTKKNKIKDTNIFNTVGFCSLKKTMVKSVINEVWRLIVFAPFLIIIIILLLLLLLLFLFFSLG
jgi:hypothetical protein